MSLAQGNNTPTRPRIEPGSPDPESNALTTRPVRSPYHRVLLPKDDDRNANSEDPNQTASVGAYDKHWLGANSTFDLMSRSV